MKLTPIAAFRQEFIIRQNSLSNKYGMVRSTVVIGASGFLGDDLAIAPDIDWCAVHTGGFARHPPARPRARPTMDKAEGRRQNYEVKNAFRFDFGLLFGFLNSSLLILTFPCLYIGVNTP